jgi:hypothetical protein
MGIRVAQRKLTGKAVNGDHGTWNVLVRIFVKNIRVGNTVLVRSTMKRTGSFRRDK